MRIVHHSENLPKLVSCTLLVTTLRIYHIYICMNILNQSDANPQRPIDIVTDPQRSQKRDQPLQQLTHSDRPRTTKPQRQTHSDQLERPTHSDQPTAINTKRPTHSNQERSTNATHKATDQHSDQPTETRSTATKSDAQSHTQSDRPIQRPTHSDQQNRPATDP